MGYAVCFKMLVSIPQAKQRYLVSALWFTFVQLIQLSWLLSHPFFYIYFVYPALALLLGAQFGVLGLFIQPRQFDKIQRLAAIAGLWTLLEWSRLFLFSGMSLNPAGIALASSPYAFQTAAIWGVFGLSFWIIFTNLLALRAFETWPSRQSAVMWGTAWTVFFLFGVIHFHSHEHNLKTADSMRALLVQTAFPVEENLPFQDTPTKIAYVLSEWRQILKMTQPHVGKSFDLLVLPENTVPFGAYSCLYPHTEVVRAFQEIYGSQSLAYLPPFSAPFATEYQTTQGKVWMLNNAYWAQSIANIFQADILVGLEDSQNVGNERRQYYTSAMHFAPNRTQINRYDKRVLLPFAEYLPFSFLQSLTASYGIGGFFTPGTEAKIFACKHLVGPSICYEETFGHIMRANKLLGADVLVNLTSDVWYPNSRLAQQHFDHARLRTVENGLPLLRACNTGVTSGIDSLGRIVATYGDPPAAVEWVPGSLDVRMPMYSYQTIYSYVGDYLIVALSLLFVVFGLVGQIPMTK